MRKRLVLGLACATFLFILFISSDSDIVLRVTPFLGYNQERDISCYEESSTNDGIEEFDSDGGDALIPPPISLTRIKTQSNKQ